MKKIARLMVNGFMGIEVLDVSFGSKGAIVKGPNGCGKTSVLNALRAGLAGVGIGTDAIRIGADRAEILIDLDAVSVKRVISSRQSTLQVTTADGFRAPKPQTYLAELLGTSPLDPLDLFLAKPKERRTKILAALPVKVTAAQLRTWAPDVPDDVDVSGHGLDVVAHWRKQFYDARTDANRSRDEAEREAARLAGDVAHAGDVTGSQSEADAQGALDAARTAAATLDANAAAAKAARERTYSARARVHELRDAASEQRAAGDRQRPSEDAVALARRDAASADARVRDLERQLAEAKPASASAIAMLNELLDELGASDALKKEADELEAKADELETTLAAAAPADVSESDVAAAHDRVTNAERALDSARSAAVARDLRDRADVASRDAAEAKERAAALDRTVRTLTDVAPAELLASCGSSLAGVAIDGDEVLVDGKRLDALSGAEQMRFAVEIAKRLNAKSKILIVDGLERLDLEQRERFVRDATADDWQLLATLVDQGELVFAAIESDEEAEAAR
jgi:hypothetical protein